MFIFIIAGLFVFLFMAALLFGRRHLFLLFPLFRACARPQRSGGSGRMDFLSCNGDNYFTYKIKVNARRLFPFSFCIFVVKILAVVWLVASSASLRPKLTVAVSLFNFFSFAAIILSSVFIILFLAAISSTFGPQ